MKRRTGMAVFAVGAVVVALLARGLRQPVREHVTRRAEQGRHRQGLRPSRQGERGRREPARRVRGRGRGEREGEQGPLGDRGRGDHPPDRRRAVRRSLVRRPAALRRLAARRVHVRSRRRADRGCRSAPSTVRRTPVTDPRARARVQARRRPCAFVFAVVAHAARGVLGVRRVRRHPRGAGVGGPDPVLGVRAPPGDRAAVRRRSPCSSRSSATSPHTEVLGMSLSVPGLWGAWNILIKGTLGVAATGLLVATTDVRDLLQALDRLHVPKAFTAIAGFMIRYGEVIAGELRQMRIARISRGHDPRWIWQARAVAATAGTLFIRSYERGERVYLAMASRGLRRRRRGGAAHAHPPGTGSSRSRSRSRSPHRRGRSMDLIDRGRSRPRDRRPRVRVSGRSPGAVRRRPDHSSRRASRAPRPERSREDDAGAPLQRRPRRGAGTVTVGGLPVEKRHLAEIRRRVGIVFQDPDDQLFMPTVRDDVAFGPTNFGVRGARARCTRRRCARRPSAWRGSPTAHRITSASGNAGGSRSPPCSRAIRSCSSSTSRRRTSIPRAGASSPTSCAAST